jgi:hypothetical protein
MMAPPMLEANGDSTHPKGIWNVDNTPRRWFGYAHSGEAVAVNNPDDVNRNMPIADNGRSGSASC